MRKVYAYQWKAVNKQTPVSTSIFSWRIELAYNKLQNWEFYARYGITFGWGAQ
jgi:hypothetical protein